MSSTIESHSISSSVDLSSIHHSNKRNGNVGVTVPVPWLSFGAYAGQLLACNPSLFSPFALYSTAIDRMSSEQSLLRVIDSEINTALQIDDPDLQELVQAAILLHPSFITVNNIKGGKVPIAILGAEIDRLSPPALLKQFEEILASKPEDKNRLFAWDK
ncbi:unnamed protein product [Brassica oleracea]|uniref:(rape) hypothetical protein n=1 Tax=Brassica napus TaxID=3708 RepID=A0A816JW93_BRANA|nr:unnamed protein product [Brassica napus]CAF1864318.1 unnamed protein product [Brassica napus]